MKCVSFKLDENQYQKLEEMVKESEENNRSKFIKDKLFNSNTKKSNGDTSGDTLFKEAFLELYPFLKEVSKSSILSSVKNYNKWVELIHKRDMKIIDDAKNKLIKEGLLDE